MEKSPPNWPLQFLIRRRTSVILSLQSTDSRLLIDIRRCSVFVMEFHGETKGINRANWRPRARFLGRAAGRITDEFFRNKACRLGRSGEGTSRHANRHKAVHGGFNLMQRDRTRVIGNRPSLQQPVPHLFDRAELLDIPVRRHHKGKGSPPVNFDQLDVFLDGRMKQAYAPSSFRAEWGRRQADPTPDIPA